MSKSQVQTSPTPWFVMFERLRQYKKKHGHCCVTHDVELQDWTLVQVRSYKNGSLGASHKKMLEAIGLKFPTKFLVVMNDPDDEHDDTLKRSDGNKVPADPTKKEPPENKPLEANMKFVYCNAQPVWPHKIPPAKKKELAAPSAPPSTDAKSSKSSPAPTIPKDPPNPKDAPLPVKKSAPKITLLATAAKDKRGGPAKEVWCGTPDDKLECGWPPGWLKRTFQRTSGASIGTFDSYWYPPQGKRLRSMVEVRRFLGLPPRPQTKNKVPRKKRPASAVSTAPTTNATNNTRTASNSPNAHAKRRAKKAKKVAVVQSEQPRFSMEELLLVRGFVPK